MPRDFARRLRVRLVSGIAIGAMLAAQATAQITTTYTYDALGRVTSAVNSDGKTIGYAYDAAGNRIQVSATTPADELIPTAFTTSQTQSGDGLTTPNGMRDGAFDTFASMHGTSAGAGNWITADLGAAKVIDHVDLAPTSVQPWAVSNTNGLQVQWSTDNTNWTTVTTTSGAVLDQYMTIPMGSVTAQYIRLLQPAAIRLSVGDFRIYGHSVVTNHPPVADNFPATVASTGGVISLAGHIHDADTGDTLTISGFNSPTAASHGTVTTASSTSFNYAPNAGATSDTFSYSITDSHSAPVTGTITVTIAAAPPIASGYNTSVTENTTNNSLPAQLSGGTANSVAITTQPGHGGSATVNGLGFLYTPGSNYFGPDSISYTATGPGGTSNTATINITVNQAPPNAQGGGATIACGSGPVTFPAQFGSGGGQATSLQIVTQPTYGTVTTSGLNFTYTPGSTCNVFDPFTYRAIGPGGQSNIAQAGVSILASTVPTVGNVTMSVGYNSSNNPVPTVVLSGSATTFWVVQGAGPTHGTVNGSGTGSLTYTPSAGFGGADDGFTYFAENSVPQAGNTATVTIHVAAGPPQLTGTVSTNIFTETRNPSSNSYSPSFVQITPQNYSSLSNLTYTWYARPGADSHITLLSSTPGTASWTGPSSIPTGGGDWKGVWYCVVTDSATGATWQSPDISVEIIYDDGS